MNIFGRALQGIGRTYDYLTPGSGTSSLTQIGRGMVAPATYTGGGTDVDRVNTPQPSTTPYTGVLGANMTVDSGGSGGANAGLIGSIYDSRNARLNNLLAGLDPQRDQALNLFNQNASIQEQALNNAIGTGRSNLDFQEEQNRQSKARSYRDIAQGIRNTLESSASRLGAMNAGDSSAAQMLQYALANLQSQQRGQANDVFGTNQAQIGMARTNMENEFTNQLNAFNQEKRNRIQEIADQYSQIRQGILDQIAQSDEARAFELANLGQQYTSKALSDISRIENDYSRAAQDWVQRATSAVPQINTQPFNQTAQTSEYGAYGRGSLPTDNISDQQMTDALDAAGMPIRRYKDQYSF